MLPIRNEYLLHKMVVIFPLDNTHTHTDSSRQHSQCELIGEKNTA